MRTAVASAVVWATGGALFWRGTDGFRAFTTEQARRLAVATHPRSLPPVALDDQDGRPFTLASYRGEPVAVDFVYTQCVTLCTNLSAAFQRLDRAERARAVGGSVRLRLVTISFDPRDTPEQLRLYASRYQADGNDWRFARAHDARELPALLSAFGITVIRDARGDFQHNAALHLLNADGRLSRVLDIDADVGDAVRATPVSRQ
ncbi:MAG TPA: SCO family protein [Gemmatimonadaceae bacterium]|jgi:protein SCO1/2|nr:SCO family protein [Gemmatimonadaceae bacterium]